jgi:hypothetical protein
MCLTRKGRSTRPRSLTFARRSLDVRPLVSQTPKEALVETGGLPSPKTSLAEWFDLIGGAESRYFFRGVAPLNMIRKNLSRDRVSSPALKYGAAGMICRQTRSMEGKAPRSRGGALFRRFSNERR